MHCQAILKRSCAYDAGSRPLGSSPTLARFMPLSLEMWWASVGCLYSHIPAGRLSQIPCRPRLGTRVAGDVYVTSGRAGVRRAYTRTARSAFDSKACEMAGMSPLSMGRAGLRASRGSRSVSGPSRPWKDMRLAEDIQREEDRGDGLARRPAGLECGASTRRRYSSLRFAHAMVAQAMSPLT